MIAFISYLRTQQTVALDKREILYISHCNVQTTFLSTPDGACLKDLGVLNLCHCVSFLFFKHTVSDYLIVGSTVDSRSSEVD